MTSFFSGIQDYKDVCPIQEAYYDKVSVENGGITSLISALSLTALSYYLLWDSKFNKHPYPLIGRACAAEAFFYFNNFMRDKICHWYLGYSLGYTLYPLLYMRQRLGFADILSRQQL